MSNRPKPSGVEKILGHIATEASLTIVAAIVGGPLAPLLPVLTKSLAASRQQDRVEKVATGDSKDT